MISCSMEQRELTCVDLSKKNFEQIILRDNDYVTNWRKVKLETTLNSLITPSYQIYPCDSFIIAYQYNRILQFDYTGKFVREIAGPGNAPNEINNLLDCIVDEKNNKLYWTELYDPEYIHAFDLANGNFVDPIPVFAEKPLKKIQLINSDTLLCFPYVGDLIQVCYRQDLLGKLVGDDVPFFEDRKGPFVSTPLNVFSINKEWFYQGIYEDTVYNSLTHLAIIVLKKGEFKISNTKDRTVDQNQILLNGIYYSNGKYIFSRTQYDLRSVDDGLFEMYPKEKRYFLFDYFKDHVSEVTTFFFEPLEAELKGADLISFFDKASSFNEKKIVINFPAEYFNYSFDENPILFIGDLK